MLGIGEVVWMQVVTVDNSTPRLTHPALERMIGDFLCRVFSGGKRYLMGLDSSRSRRKLMNCS
jgi:hypothetical protein